MISLDELRRKQPGTVIGVTASELLALVALAELTGGAARSDTGESRQVAAGITAAQTVGHGGEPSSSGPHRLLGGVLEVAE